LVLCDDASILSFWIFAFGVFAIDRFWEEVFEYEKRLTILLLCGCQWYDGMMVS